MGIEGFQPWIRNRFRSLVRNSLSWVQGDDRPVRNLYVDYNGIIHIAVNIAYDTPDEAELERMNEAPEEFWLSTGGVLDTLVNEIIDILAIVKPTKLMYIAADGVVPKAKLLQQRQRSFAVKPGSGGPFNRNNIKPGTEFMMVLSNELRKRIQKMGWENVQGMPSRVEFSDATLPGEGEHKIMTRLRSSYSEGKVGRIDRFVDVIYSSDSDMILLTMVHADPKATIIVMRQTHTFDVKAPETIPSNENEGSDPSSLNFKYEFYNVTEIRREFSRSGIWEPKDLVLITCFAGNDFMPGLAFTRQERQMTFKLLVDTYFSVFGNRGGKAHLVRNGKIDWMNLSRYLNFLISASNRQLESLAAWQKSHEKLLYDETSGEDRRWEALSSSVSTAFKKSASKFDSSYFSGQYRKFANGIFLNPDTLQSLAEDSTINTSLNFDMTPEMCKKYLEALVWVTSYYETQGKNVNTDWCYNFHYAPDVGDLSHYLALNVDEPTWIREPTLPIHIAHSPVEHLLCILRYQDLNLVPTIARLLFVQKMPSLFPEEVQIDATLLPIGEARGAHKAIVMINYPNMTKVRTLFDSIRDDTSVKGRNAVNSKIKVWPSGKKMPKKYQ